MRVFILALVTFISLSVKAQSPYFYPSNQFSDSAALTRKWHLNGYGGISSGMFIAGNNSYLAAPIGLQINRRLNNNLYAFAGVAAAPAYYNFNSTFGNTGAFQSYPGIMNPAARGFGMQTRVEMGLMYVNDARTFSISGSIGVTRGSYPGYPAYGPYPQKPQAAPSH